jgi:hypothetical protein
VSPSDRYIRGQLLSLALHRKGSRFTPFQRSCPNNASEIWLPLSSLRPRLRPRIHLHHYDYRLPVTSEKSWSSEGLISLRTTRNQCWRESETHKSSPKSADCKLHRSAYVRVHAHTRARFVTVAQCTYSIISGMQLPRITFLFRPFSLISRRTVATTPYFFSS